MSKQEAIVKIIMMKGRIKYMDLKKRMENRKPIWRMKGGKDD